MYIHDIIKIKYSTEGYLPNYPPHLISDEEMFDAFINNEINYFYSNYTLKAEELQEAYDLLITAIKYHISVYLNTYEANREPLPDWVYSYMLGVVINQNSDQRDRHYLFTGINEDNIPDEFTEDAQKVCYKISTRYVNRLAKNQKEKVVNGEIVYLRPPTMFGEPHVLKQIRLMEVV